MKRSPTLLRHARCALPLFLAAVLLGGCTGLLSSGGKGETPSYYLLAPPGDEEEAGQAAAGTAVIVILEPSLPGALATDGIAVRVGRHRIAYLQGARWSDEAPVMLARLLRHAADTLPGVTAISEDEVGIVPQWRLVSELDAFYAETDGAEHPPERVTVRMTARLLAARPQDLVAEQNFQAEAAIVGADTEAVVAAFEEAIGAVTAQLRGWLAAQFGTSGGGPGGQGGNAGASGR